MGLILSSKNVVNYLKQNNIYSQDFQPAFPVTVKESKNFNIVVTSTTHKSFIVKQNRVDLKGNTSGNLLSEWIFQELINAFSNLASIQPLVSETILFDRANSIIVSVFYNEYVALDDYYETHQSYHPKIANRVGMNLAKIHRATYQQLQHREYLGRHCNLDSATRPPGFVSNLNSLSPSIFGKICPDGLDFYRLYQRFPSLHQAVIELYDHIQPACLAHNDLTLDNFIIDPQIGLESDVVQIRPEQVKIIDWEFNYWGDPADDLGMLVSQYMAEWLNSLVADPSLDLNTTLSLATCPLEKITPSLRALLRGYLTAFPEILKHRRDFIKRVIQFAGIGIIDRLSYYVEYHYPFNNEEICKLQVAKNLLCHPDKSCSTIFGSTEAELMNHMNPKSLASLKATV